MGACLNKETCPSQDATLTCNTVPVVPGQGMAPGHRRAATDDPCVLFSQGFRGDRVAPHSSPSSVHVITSSPDLAGVFAELCASHPPVRLSDDELVAAFQSMRGDSTKRFSRRRNALSPISSSSDTSPHSTRSFVASYATAAPGTVLALLQSGTTGTGQPQRRSGV